jgi:hypothetical protein
VTVQVVCPGVVATEFHERQGLDLSTVPRMSAADVVTASLRGLELGGTVCAPGVGDASLLDAVFQADLGAFGAQSPEPPSILHRPNRPGRSRKTSSPQREAASTTYQPAERAQLLPVPPASPDVRALAYRPAHEP